MTTTVLTNVNTVTRVPVTVAVMSWHKCRACRGNLFWNVGEGIVQVKDVDRNRHTLRLSEGARHLTECRCGSKNTVTVTRMDGALTLVIL